jgi:hypothetical protein
VSLKPPFLPYEVVIGYGIIIANEPTFVIAERTAVTTTTSSSCFWRIALFLDEEDVCMDMVDWVRNQKHDWFITGSQNHMLSDLINRTPKL